VVCGARFAKFCDYFVSEPVALATSRFSILRRLKVPKVIVVQDAISLAGFLILLLSNFYSACSHPPFRISNSLRVRANPESLVVQQYVLSL
jgi:hypothetical protein